MARLFGLSILLVFLLIESTFQERHGFSSDLLHVYDETKSIGSPATITPEFLDSFVQNLIMRSKRDTKISNDDKTTKSTVNNAKIPESSASNGNSTAESQIPMKNNATTQTINNITTMVRFFRFEENKKIPIVIIFS